MDIFSGLEKIVEKDYKIAAHTWYGLGGPVDYFIRPETVEQLRTVQLRCRENKIPVYVMGFGSNLLIADDGLKAAVVKFDTEQFCQSEFKDEVIEVGAGADLGRLVLDCVNKGLSGLEALSGIPGSVGGAVKMNAGGRFGDVGAVVEMVTVMDNQGDVFETSKPELNFDYRSTNITGGLILNARLKVTKADPEQVLRTVKEVWIYKKNHQPLNTKNSGCVFKNSRGVSAGALIDRAGLKGLQMGGAQVSEKHANFIIAQKGCTSRDILKLIDKMKQTVNEQFDVELELELEIWE